MKLLVSEKRLYEAVQTLPPALQKGFMTAHEYMTKTQTTNAMAACKATGVVPESFYIARRKLADMGVFEKSKMMLLKGSPDQPSIERRGRKPRKPELITLEPAPSPKLKVVVFSGTPDEIKTVIANVLN